MVATIEQKGQIYGLIPKIMSEVGAVTKSRKNPQQGYSFRGIDDVLNALHGVLAANGVFFSPEVLEMHRQQAGETKNGSAIWAVQLKVAFTFFASDGSSFRAVTAGEGLDFSDKATNKSLSAALKYALLQVFCIPTEEDKDSENDTPEARPVREVVNEETGEVQQGKKFAVPKAMAKEELERAHAAIDTAFQARGIAPDKADEIVRQLLLADGITGINVAGRTWIRELIKGINAGQYDPTPANGKAAK